MNRHFVLPVGALTVISLVLNLTLRILGWDSTVKLFDYSGRLLIAGLPLILVLSILAYTRLRCSVRSLFAILLLAALFLVMTLLPLLRFRNERFASTKLLAAGAKEDQSILNWKPLWTIIDTLPEARNPPPTFVPSYLRSFTQGQENIPRDCEVTGLLLANDEQRRILADNWPKLPNLQALNIGPSVSAAGLTSLMSVLPEIKTLDIVITQESVDMPVEMPSGWYQLLANVRVLYVWRGWSLQAPKFDKQNLADIVKLPKLKVLSVKGYAFNDSDAEALLGSESIQHIFFATTHVTEKGRDLLTKNNRNVTFW